MTPEVGAIKENVTTTEQERMTARQKLADRLVAILKIYPYHAKRWAELIDRQSDTPLKVSDKERTIVEVEYAANGEQIKMGIGLNGIALSRAGARGDTRLVVGSKIEDVFNDLGATSFRLTNGRLEIFNDRAKQQTHVLLMQFEPVKDLGGIR